jgi:AcrR family transcriptional regulator
MSRETAFAAKEASPIRQRRRPSEVRSALAKSAREVFEQRGFGGATTREIAEHAGVNEVMIFRHFTNKANLFAETVSKPFAQLLEGLLQSEMSEPPAATDLESRRRFVGRLITALRSNSDLVMAVINAHAYDRRLGGIPTLNGYFATSLERLKQTVMGRTVDPERLDQLMRCGFAAVVGCVLFEDWILKDQFADEGERLAVLTQFVDFGMYGLPAGSEKEGESS